ALLERIAHFEEFGEDPEGGSSSRGRRADAKAAEDYMKVIQRQAREIALISSAWYDQQSRLQHGSVPIPRLRQPTLSSSAAAADIHRSWLAKQRVLVRGD
ncbi:hypothetical protein KEM52_002473, partial [Ascosphaera acerosa]